MSDSPRHTVWGFLYPRSKCTTSPLKLYQLGSKCTSIKCLPPSPEPQERSAPLRPGSEEEERDSPCRPWTSKANISSILIT